MVKVEELTLLGDKKRGVRSGGLVDGLGVVFLVICA